MSDEGVNAILRCFSVRELELAYRITKLGDSEQDQHAAFLIGLELIRRTIQPCPKQK